MFQLYAMPFGTEKCRWYHMFQLYAMPCGIETCRWYYMFQLYTLYAMWYRNVSVVPYVQAVRYAMWYGKMW